MGSWFARWFCCESGWRNLSKYNSASVASGSSATEDDALIGQASSSSSTGRSDSKDNNGRIAFLSRGRIKYVKGCWNMGIPIIDPHLVIGQQQEPSSDYMEPAPPPAAQQRQQLLPQLARILVNKNIFHWNHYLNRGSTPPSSIDLEWEHEVGMLPPLVPDDSGGFELDFEEEEEEECGKVGDGRASPSDSAIHRSPSPSSLCHSLEWDSNEFVIQDQPVHQGRLAVIS